MLYRILPALAVATTVLAACGDIAFKQGGSPEDMKAADMQCRRAGTEYAAYADCMQGRGWKVVRIDALMLLEGESVETALASAPAATGEASAAAPGTPHGTAVSAAVLPSASAPGNGVSKPALDPLSRVAVASWWKVGSGPDELLKERTRCEQKLGPAHEVDAHSGRVTRGLIGCLREAGWAAIGTRR